MKINQFVAKVRKGDNYGLLEITIPTEFHRANGILIGDEFIFTVQKLKKR